MEYTGDISINNEYSITRRKLKMCNPTSRRHYCLLEFIRITYDAKYIVLGKLKAAGLSLNITQSLFFRKVIEFLGNIITEGQVKHNDTSNIEFKEPVMLRELRSFLGLENLCSEFLKQFAMKVGLMTVLLQGESKNSKKNKYNGQQTRKKLYKR